MNQDIDPSASTLSAIARLVDSGRVDEAERQARELIRRDPGDGGAWRVLGFALLRGANRAEAGTALQKAVDLNAQDAAAFEYLGWLHRRSENFEAAVEALKASLGIDPTRIRARVMLASSYKRLKQAGAAIAQYEHLLELAPDHARAHASLAELLAQARRFQEASTHRARAAELSPTLTNLINAAHDARKICDWATAEWLEKVAVQKLRSGPEPTDYPQPFPVLEMPIAEPRDILAAGAQVASHYLSMPAQPHAMPADLAADKRLRIGYLSPDMRNHPMVHLSIQLFELHDRSRFEIILFDYAKPSDSIYRRRALAAFDKVVTIRERSDAEAAKAIAEERIAIVVDAAGWTTGGRSQILASRPAPLNVQWMGFAGTMGAPWIDYIVADWILAPPGSEPEFSEKLLRLPHTYQCNDRKRRIGDKVTRAEAGLPQDTFVFCCFNQSFKMNREVFAIWMELLRQRPEAVLWLLQENEWAVAALRQHAKEFGIAPERLVFAPRVDLARHLARLSLADLALDCTPYGSHTTASDALWAGVPQLALRGRTFAARVSASLLTAIGLPELIAESQESYRDLALRLSADRALLAEYKARLAANRLTTPLFDSGLFTRHLEAGYEAIWRRCLDGLPPDHIAVPETA